MSEINTESQTSAVAVNPTTRRFMSDAKKHTQKASEEMRRGFMSWRCFHCGEVFHSKTRAALHFGAINDVVACKINAEIFRKLERELAAYRREDTDLHRQIHSLIFKNQLEMRQAEESGYDKGLRDGLKLAAKKEGLRFDEAKEKKV